MSFGNLRANRQKHIQNLTNEMQKSQNQDKGYGDDRFWKIERDKSGNGHAVIRFLDVSDGEDLPWAKFWDHGFQGPGGWYIENSLTTIGKQDPVSEYNTELWNNGTEAGKEQARKQKRRLRYVSNVLILKDPANPHNEGQIKLFQYGKRIHDKIMEVMYPEFPDQEKIYPFCYHSGADFKLRVRLYDGFVNYDKSDFDSPRQLIDTGDEKQDNASMEALWKKQYKLSEFTDPDGGRFKSYEELKAKLNRILGLDGGAKELKSESAEELPSAYSQPSFGTKEPEQIGSTEVNDNFSSTESEVTMSYFEKLANT